MIPRRALPALILAAALFPSPGGLSPAFGEESSPAAPVTAEEPLPLPEEPSPSAVSPEAGGASTPEGGAGGNSPLQEAAAETEEPDLFLRTLPLDIATADYYELLAWCRRLGLEDTGKRGELQNRLYGYYRLGAPAPAASGQGNQELLTVQEAQVMEFLNSGGETPSLLRLEGEVKLEFREKGGTLHSISADVLEFNKEERLLTAYGNVLYTLDKGGDAEPEIFRGTSLTFDVDTWAGMFFDGLSQRDTTINEESIRFVYSGDVIYRSPDNTVILDNGTITTCDEPDPHLRIKARKIWVLAPGEWAISHALFYVGRVPLFYLPGFIKNGDPFVFNPVAGYGTDRGYFVQTSTYLLGEKAKAEEDSIIDFMQLGGGEDLQRTRDGLFLREAEELSPRQEALKKYARDTDSRIMLMADGYTYMGGAGGITGSLAELGPLSNLDFYLSMGKSREVFYTGGVYTPFYRNGDGEYVSNWEDGYFLRTRVPFRFGLDITAALDFKKAGFSLDLDFPFYSDPFYLEDFNDRQERMELDALTSLQDATETLRRSGTDLEISSETWSLDAAWTPEWKGLTPWVKNLKITKFNNSMVWSRKAYAAPDVISSIDEFFYPSSFTLMDFALVMDGSLLGTGSSGGEGQEEAVEDPGFVSPWSDRQESSGAEASGEEPFILPALQGDVKLPGGTGALDYSQSLTWNLKPTGSLYGKFNYLGWTVPEDIDYGLEYQVFRGSGSGSLDYTGKLAEDLLKFSGSLGVTGKYNQYFNRGDTVTDTVWNGYLDQARALNSLKVTETLSVSTAPFLSEDSRFSGSTLTYSLKSSLFQWEYDADLGDYRQDLLAWNGDTVDENRLALNLKYLALDVPQVLTLTADLPPDSMEYAAKMVMTTGPLTSTVSQVLSEDEDQPGDWTWEPLEINEKILLTSGFSLVQILGYDWEENGWGTATTRGEWTLKEGDVRFTTSFVFDFQEGIPESGTLGVKLWFFSLDFRMSNTMPYDFDPALGWVVESGAESRFLPDTLKMGFSWQTPSWRFWHDRIDLSGEIVSVWDLDLIQFTDSPMTFNFQMDLEIDDFLTLSVASKSRNKSTYRYFPWLADAVGVEPVNPFTDILKSFNFFNPQDRLESNFNLSSLTVSLTHDLHDWDLNLEYEGAPELVKDGGYYVYQWRSTLSVYIQWKAWRDLQARVDADEGGLVF